MEQSHLYELIKRLSPEEREEVLPFAKVSFFNSGRMRAQVGPLIELCSVHLQENPEGILEKSTVYDIVFPGQDYVEGKLEKVMVEAQKLIRQFLLTKYYFREENEFHQTLDFAEIARQRGLDGKYRQSMERLNKIQEKTPVRHATHFLQQLQLEGAIHYAQSITNQNKGDINIANLIHATEMFYHIRRVSLLSRYLLQLRVAKLEIPVFIQQLLEELEVPERCLAESAQLKINFEIFKMIKKDTPEIEEVQVLLALLQEREADLDHETSQEFYTYLRNFATLLGWKHPEKLEINYMLHDLFLDNLERGYLHYEGKLTPNRCLVIVENALAINAFEWAMEFLETNKNLIHGENESHDIYRYIQARYLFATGKYDQCLDMLPETSLYLEFLLLGRRLEIKAYYELGSDLFQYKLDAFSVYLSRTSPKILSEKFRQANVLFTNFLTQITSSIPGDIDRANLVYKRIHKNRQVIDWHWLLEKADALKSKR